MLRGELYGAVDDTDRIAQQWQQTLIAPVLQNHQVAEWRQDFLCDVEIRKDRVGDYYQGTVHM
ncbi:hypothetical protein Tamer19_70190 [Cupriavidus sp. TA19]|nr:hypothetical protein Tamer19_70190 [Cupriavidus sp. TA19]